VTIALQCVENCEETSLVFEHNANSEFDVKEGNLPVPIELSKLKNE
jgi:hypothetical protein